MMQYIGHEHLLGLLSLSNSLQLVVVNALSCYLKHDGLVHGGLWYGRSNFLELQTAVDYHLLAYLNTMLISGSKFKRCANGKKAGCAIILAETVCLKRPCIIWYSRKIRLDRHELFLCYQVSDTRFFSWTRNSCHDHGRRRRGTPSRFKILEGTYPLKSRFLMKIFWINTNL